MTVYFEMFLFVPLSLVILLFQICRLNVVHKSVKLMDFSLVPYFSLRHCLLASRQPCQICRRRPWLIVSCPGHNWSVATAVGWMFRCDTRTASYWGLP
jgi:hypothetical protein